MTLWLYIYCFLRFQEFVSLVQYNAMTSAQILSVVQVNCLVDFFCFLFILYTTEERHAFNIYHVLIKAIQEILTIIFFLIKVKCGSYFALMHNLASK